LGIATVMEVADLALMTAKVPPKETCSPARRPVVSAVKSAPVMTRGSPRRPVSGVNPVGLGGLP